MSLQLELDSLSLDNLSQIPDLSTLSIKAGNDKPSCFDNEESQTVLIFSPNGRTFGLVYDGNSGRTLDQIIQMLTETGILDSLGIDSDSDNTHDPEGEDAH
jgi:hypothetical protein